MKKLILCAIACLFLTTSCFESEEKEVIEIDESKEEVVDVYQPTDTTENERPCMPINHKTELITSNWEIINTDFTGQSVDFFDENFGVVAGMNAVLITEDAGQNWKHQPTPMSSTFFKVKTFDIGKFYISRLSLYKTTDNGKSYSDIANLENKGGSVFNFHFFDSSSVILSQGHTIKISEDGGQTWQINRCRRALNTVSG